jgi:Flp pilus assembly protein TadB
MKTVSRKQHRRTQQKAQTQRTAEHYDQLRESRAKRYATRAWDAQYVGQGSRLYAIRWGFAALAAALTMYALHLHVWLLVIPAIFGITAAWYLWHACRAFAKEKRMTALMEKCYTRRS